MVEQLWQSPDIFRILVPLPDNPLKYLNVYVVRGPTHALIIDTGFNRAECRAALWDGIRELKLDLSKSALFLTHLHADHTGLVWDFVERNIPVYMGQVVCRRICFEGSLHSWPHARTHGSLFAKRTAVVFW